MEEKNKFPFPQANDFEKIVKILEIEEEKLIDKKMIQKIINVNSDRQVQYYISACQFIGLVTRDYRFTSIARKIKMTCYENKIVILSRLIVSAPVFGEVFFKKYLYNEELDNDEIAQLINVLWNEEESVAVCKRRSSTVKSWVDWIFKQKEYESSLIDYLD